jgi:RNA polymerase sigma-70 factor (ECF subfamily)
MFFFGLTAMEEAPDALYESCIGKIADGDKAALGTLYEHTKSAVYGFALSIVQNAQDAEDVLQDTFVSVFASARSYQRMGKPMAWVLTITRNLALMKIRSRRKTAGLPEEEWSLFIADRATVTSEDKLVLAAALKEVTPEESQIIMLHAVAGFKHREIAEVLELPLSTVLSKYNRAIKKLKSVLEEGDGHAK